MGEEKTRAELLSFWSFLVGLLAIFWRIPTMIRYVKKGLALKDDKRLSWGSMLETTAARYPDRPAVKSEETVVTYRAFNELVNQYAHVLLKHGVKKGDTVVVYLENRLDLLALYSALAKIGAPCALINTQQRGKTLQHSLALDPCRCFIIGDELHATFEEVKLSLDLAIDTKLFWVPDSASGSDPPAGTIDLRNEASSAPRDNPETTREVRLKDPLAYVYTSGTTGGKPKAAVITHRRVVSGALWMGRIVCAVKPSDTIYVPLPFFHTNALNVAWPPALHSGAAIAIRRKFSVRSFLDDIRKYGATHFVYVGEICRYLLSLPARPDDADTPLRVVLGNGLRPDIWHAFKKRFGIEKVYEFYGAADGVGVFTNILNRDSTVGICPVPHAIVHYDVVRDELVRDPEGRLLKVGKGETGLLIMEIRPGTPFAGYTDRKRTEEKILHDVFKEGDAWLNTGDLLCSIGYGHAQFVDRLGDTFRWKGENVSTTEVESVANNFSQIELSSVYGVKMHDGDGRAGMMSIVTDTPHEQFDLKGLFSHLAESLPPYAMPIFLRFSQELESTATHKTVKYAAKQEGYDPGKVRDPLFVLLPGKTAYCPLSEILHREIQDGRHRF